MSNSSYEYDNVLLETDVYKMGHMEQFAPGTSKVYSYLCARSDKFYHDCIFFGLQYYLHRFLCAPIHKEDAEEFLFDRRTILGSNSKEIEQKIYALAEMQHWPLEIKAMPEGAVCPVKNALFTITNTEPGFHWCVGFVESLLLKVWYPITVATNVMRYRRVVDRFHDATVGRRSPDVVMRDFMVHDFGYRSDSSNESSAIAGAAFLLHFRGSDTVTALRFLRNYYGVKRELDVRQSPMLSVPATEHSVMCSYGKDGELDAFNRMLELYPEGIVSIVSDTYDVYHVCTKYLPELKDRIMARDGKVVIRPDSGNPPDIICGDPEAPVGSPRHKGVLRLLDETFGSEKNEHGFKVLNSKIGLIYGDGMYMDRYKNTLERMRLMGYAANNLVIGVGGILRQGERNNPQTRDTLGMALKATYVIRDGKPMDIIKTPVTDVGKHSHTGLMQVYYDADGRIVTKDQATPGEEAQSVLSTVFKNGKLIRPWTFDEVKRNLADSKSAGALLL